MSLNVEQNTSTNFCNNYSKSNCARKEIKIIYFDVFILQEVLRFIHETIQHQHWH